jgi:hypothetical protein
MRETFSSLLDLGCLLFDGQPVSWAPWIGRSHGRSLLYRIHVMNLISSLFGMGASRFFISLKIWREATRAEPNSDRRSSSMLVWRNGETTPM